LKERKVLCGHAKQKSGDEYKDVCFPITKEAREYIEAAVLARFEESGT